MAPWTVLLLLVAPALCGCKKEARVIERPPPLVTVTRAVTRNVPLYLDEIGLCTAFEAVSIQPQASGQIVGRHFIDGADIQKNDPLFTIDPRPYQAALDQAKATLAQNEASLSLAILDYERGQKLYPLKAMSKEDLETRQSTVEADKALVLANKAAVETAQVNLDYCFIRSPINGRAGQRQVDTGNILVANSGTTLLSIQRMDPIYADFTITERDLAGVRREMAKGTLKARVRLPDEPDTAAREGDLTFLDNAVVEATGTVKLRATLPNADRHFWPGQFVQVRLVLSTLKDAVLVPSQATQVSQFGAYVYVIGPDQKAESRPVLLGQPQGALVVVLNGLKAGEQVAVTGQLLVIPGAPVRIQPPASQPAGAGGKVHGAPGGPASVPASLPTSVPAGSESGR